jgi:hypothetical protein
MAGLQIPTYQKTELPPDKGPNVLINPDAFNAGDKGMERFGAEISQSSEEVFSAVQKIQDKQEMVDALAATNEYEKSLVDRSTQMKGIVGKNVNDVSFFTGKEEDKGINLTEYEQQNLPALRKQYIEKLSPRAALMFNQRANEADVNYLHQIATHQVTEFRQYTLDQLNGAIDNSISKITENPTEETEMKQIDEIDALIKKLYPGQNVEDYRLHARNKLEDHTRNIMALNRVTTADMALQVEYQLKYPDDRSKQLSELGVDISKPEMLERLRTEFKLDENGIRRLTEDIKSADNMWTIKHKNDLAEIEQPLIDKLQSSGLNIMQFNKEVMNDKRFTAPDRDHMMALGRTIENEKHDLIVRARQEQRAIRADKRDAIRFQHEQEAIRQNAIEADIRYKIMTGEITDSSQIVRLVATDPKYQGSKKSHEIIVKTVSELKDFLGPNNTYIKDARAQIDAYAKQTETDPVKQKELAAKLHNQFTIESKGKEKEEITNVVNEMLKKNVDENVSGILGLYTKAWNWVNTPGWDKGWVAPKETVVLPDGKKYKDGDIYTDPKTKKKSRVRINAEEK